MSKPHVKPVSADAVATITVEVRNLGSWGTDCSLEQVHRQAAEAAIGYLRNFDRDSRITVIGQPEIKTVIVERKP
jgi:hypothetical protein